MNTSLILSDILEYPFRQGYYDLVLLIFLLTFFFMLIALFIQYDKLNDRLTLMKNDLIEIRSKMEKPYMEKDNVSNGENFNADCKYINDEELIVLLRDVGTGIWRMRQKLIPKGKDEPNQELLRSVFLPLESIWDKVGQEGLEIKDHTGDTFTGGEALKIIAVQPSADFSREIVIETIKPTISYRGKIIQIGEVIITGPEDYGKTAR